MNHGGKRWLKNLMRAGFVANGIVYILVGVIAVQAAFGNGQSPSGSQEALASIENQPFGQLLLSVVSLGFIGLMIWYIIRGFYDPDNKGNDTHGLVRRIGYIIASLGYGVLAYSTFRILWAGSGGSSNRTADWTAELMSQPFGIWLVGAVGLVVIGICLYQIYKAYETKFHQKLKVQEMSETEVTWGTFAGRVGIAARAIVFGIIGIFLVRAALMADPQQAGGVGEALQSLATQPFGSWLLGLIALGLVLYGVYSSVVLASYRRLSW